MDEDEEQIAVAATFGISAVFNKPGISLGNSASNKSNNSGSPNRRNKNLSKSSSPLGPSQSNVDKDRLSVDISALKQQYSKLRQRQKQAQIILSSALFCFVFVVTNLNFC